MAVGVPLGSCGRVTSQNEHPTRPDGLWERSSVEVEGDRLPGQHVIGSFSEFLLDATHNRLDFGPDRLGSHCEIKRFQNSRLCLVHCGSTCRSNACLQLLPEAGTTQEQRLEAGSCKALLDRIPYPCMRHKPISVRGPSYDNLSA